MKLILGVAFFCLAAGVGCGAFGAHGLREYFIGREEEIWKTAVFYQLIHAIGLIAIVLCDKVKLLQSRILKSCAIAMIAGIFIFSGSLYLLVLSRVKWLGAVTPIGGALLIGSWIVLGWFACRSRAALDSA